MPAITPPQIRLEQVSLTAPVGGQYLLRNITCDVFQGDRIALIGASGAGKTSLLRLLNRLDEPSEGAIYLEGQALRQIPVFRLRQQVMLVLQEPKLLGMTVAAALIYPLVLQGSSQPLIQQRLKYWSKQLQIPEDWLERSELQLSLGERQQVAIARALVTHPKLLLLDEPTAALDIARAELVLEILKGSECTSVMATHNLDLARRFANRILYLHQGELIQDTATDSVDWDQLRQTFSEQAQLTANEWN